MKTRVLLFILFAVTVFAWGTLVTVLFNTAPTGNDVIALFYLSLFLSVGGAVFFASYIFQYLRLQAIPSWPGLVAALRLGAVVSALIISLLAIRSVDLLNGATFIILLVLAVAAELILRRRTQGKLA